MIFLLILLRQNQQILFPPPAQVLYPESVHLNRGNHEDFQINQKYGFYDEVSTKFGSSHMFTLFQVSPAAPTLSSTWGKIGNFLFPNFPLSHILHFSACVFWHFFCCIQHFFELAFAPSACLATKHKKESFGEGKFAILGKNDAWMEKQAMFPSGKTEDKTA